MNRVGKGRISGCVKQLYVAAMRPRTEDALDGPGSSCLFEK